MAFRRHQAVVAQREIGRLINERLEVRLLSTAAVESRLTGSREPFVLAILVQFQALVPSWTGEEPGLDGGGSVLLRHRRTHIAQLAER